jgi:hypothetical protein
MKITKRKESKLLLIRCQEKFEVSNAATDKDVEYITDN